MGLFFRNQERSRWAFLYSRKKFSKPCDIPMPEPLDMYLRETYTDVFHACCRSLHLSERYKPPAAIRWARQYLQNSPLAVVPTDKDGGHAILTREALFTAKRTILAKPEYRQSRSYSSFPRDLIEEYAFHVRRICGELEDDELRTALLSDTHHQRLKDICAVLQVTLKTHKPDGEVTFRAIHGSPSSPFKPVTRLISCWLRPVLSNLPHLLRDTRSMITALSNTQFTGEVTFIKADIKDFFMSGEHAALEELSSTCVSAHIRRQYKRLVRFVLESQYVILDGRAVDDIIYQVTCGTGMGIGCSGDISNAAFFAMAERSWAVDPRIQASHGVCGYFRYMDDLLIVVNGTSLQRQKFLRGLRERARFFRIQVESITSESVDYLDLRIYKGTRFHKTGYLDHEVFVKPTSVWQPLRRSSFHPASVHDAWPAMMVQRYMRLCTDQHWAKTLIREFVRKMEAYGNPMNHIKIVKPCSQFEPPSPGSEFQRSRQCRLILPYHPVWRKAGILGIITSLYSKWCSVMSEDVPLPGIAWSLGNKHLMHDLRTL